MDSIYFKNRNLYAFYFKFNIINVFTVTLNYFNASLLNKMNKYKNKNLTPYFWMIVYTEQNSNLLNLD